MEKADRGNFGTKLGIILATAGGAVGLGNVWRFPFVTGQNGGAAFILIYIACVLLLGIHVMLCEMIIGSHAHANTSLAYTICLHILGRTYPWHARSVPAALSVFYHSSDTTDSLADIVDGYGTPYYYQGCGRGHREGFEDHDASALCTVDRIDVLLIDVAECI